MIKNISYKKRNKILLFAAPVAGFLLWVGVFSNTADLFIENSELKERIIKGKTAPEKIRVLQIQLAKINSLVDTYIVDSVKNREFILHQVSDFCSRNDLVLREFPQVALESDQDIQVETSKVVAEGSFSNLLKLLFEIEKVKKIARPASVTFEKIFDNKTKKNVLTISIYFQNIRIVKK